MNIGKWGLILSLFFLFPVVYNKTELYIFGGYNGLHELHFKDMYKFDTGENMVSCTRVCVDGGRGSDLRCIQASTIQVVSKCLYHLSYSCEHGTCTSARERLIWLVYTCSKAPIYNCHKKWVNQAAKMMNDSRTWSLSREWFVRYSQHDHDNDRVCGRVWIFLSDMCIISMWYHD